MMTDQNDLCVILIYCATIHDLALHFGLVILCDIVHIAAALGGLPPTHDHDHLMGHVEYNRWDSPQLS